jgi:hypothetical protein
MFLTKSLRVIFITISLLSFTLGSIAGFGDFSRNIEFYFGSKKFLIHSLAY